MTTTGTFSRLHLTLFSLLLVVAGSLLLAGCASPDSDSGGGDHSMHQHSQ